MSTSKALIELARQNDAERQALHEQNTRLQIQTAELRQQLKQAKGGYNCILIRRDGFTKLMSIPQPHENDLYSYAMSPYIAIECWEPNANEPRNTYCSAAYLPIKRLEFRRTGSRDNLGRLIYEEV